jgi:hypothetical protein
MGMLVGLRKESTRQPEKVTQKNSSGFSPIRMAGKAGDARTPRP